MLVVFVLNFSDDPYINNIFLRTMVNRLFFSSRNPKYILTEPQMPKTVLKSLQRQKRNQTFKYLCNPIVYTDYTGQFNTKYAAICRIVSTDWTSIIPIFDNGFDHHQVLLYLQRLSLLLYAAVYFKETMVLRKQVVKETLDLSLLNERRQEKSCFCIFKE